MSERDEKKPGQLDDLQPEEDPKGGVLIGLNQPVLPPGGMVSPPVVNYPIPVPIPYPNRK